MLRLLCIKITSLALMVFFWEIFYLDGAYVINLDDKESKITHWVSLFFDRNMAIYFNSFEIEYIAQEVLNKIRSITQNIFRIEDDDAIMCKFYCIVFIGYMLAGNILLDYTNLLCPDYYKRNGKIIFK